MFIKVIRHAWIENRGNSLLQQLFNVSVHQFGRVAYRIGRNGMLSFCIGFTGGGTGKYDFKSHLRQQGMPEREIFVHIQSHGNANPAKRRFFSGLIFLQTLQLKPIGIGQLGFLFLSKRPVAPVSGNISFLSAEEIDGKLAVIGTAVAGGGL